MNTALLPRRCSGPPCFARLFRDEPVEPRIPEIMLAGYDTAQQPLLRVIWTAVERAYLRTQRSVRGKPGPQGGDDVSLGWVGLVDWFGLGWFLVWVFVWIGWVGLLVGLGYWLGWAGLGYWLGWVTGWVGLQVELGYWLGWVTGWVAGWVGLLFVSGWLLGLGWVG